MPLFMDVHTIDGGVAASTVHREAHGLVADPVFLVQEGS